jgi:hypothetical protein
MRAIANAVVFSALSVAALCGCTDSDRVRIQSFTPGPAGSFVYSARTNTVMTENDDGGAELIRRDWLSQTLEAQGLCRGGYVVYQRELVIPPQRSAVIGPPQNLTFGNGGDVVYTGRCL